MADSLLSLIKENKDIFVITSDARGSAKIEKIYREYPDNFVEVGIAEQNEIGIASGMALSDKIPFVCAPAIFLSSRALDQIRVDVSYMNSNVKICGVSSGLAYGTQGQSHLAIYDIAAIRPMANMIVVSPCDAIQTDWMIKECARIKAPVYMRMGRAAVETVYSNENINRFALGKANMITDGTDLTIIATGEEVQQALVAVDLLKKQNISVRLLDMHTIKPIDKEAIIDAAKNTKKIMSVEQHSIYGGLGSAISEVLSTNYLTHLKIMGVSDEVCITGNEQEILHHYGLDGEGIARNAIDFLKES